MNTKVKDAVCGMEIDPRQLDTGYLGSLEYHPPHGHVMHK